MICSRCKKEFIHEKFKTCDNCRVQQKIYRDKIPRKYKKNQMNTIANNMKKCSDCLKIKSLDNFYTYIRNTDGYRNQCIECHSIRWKLYYNNQYYKVLKDKFENDIIYKLKQNQKTYLHQHLKKFNLTKIDSTNNYIGCSIEQLVKWLEFNFDKDMNWKNKNWQLDHIIPLSLFDLTNDYERKIAFNWTNIQPLKTTENIKKSNKFRPYEYFNSIINLFRFSNNSHDYINIKDSLQWIKQKYNLQHFQIAGNS